ncbi:hypothetical protein C8R44DRAFT_52694 [Mycena epipterygia]|nr:hypothetical protein C8R44DRAFT_52694 [Mycena epipterygia]
MRASSPPAQVQDIQNEYFHKNSFSCIPPRRMMDSHLVHVVVASPRREILKVGVFTRPLGLHLPPMSLVPGPNAGLSEAADPPTAEQRAEDRAADSALTPMLRGRFHLRPRTSLCPGASTTPAAGTLTQTRNGCDSVYVCTQGARRGQRKRQRHHPVLALLPHALSHSPACANVAAPPPRSVATATRGRPCDTSGDACMSCRFHLRPLDYATPPRSSPAPHSENHAQRLRARCSASPSRSPSPACDELSCPPDNAHSAFLC